MYFIMKINNTTISDNLNKIQGKQTKPAPQTEKTGKNFTSELDKANTSRPDAGQNIQRPMARPLTGITTMSPVSMALANSEIEEAVKLASQVPDIRQKKVDEIKEKLEKGEYKIDPRKVAQKMIDTGVADQLMRPI
jgi:flagellar biosynthesis anti-sigma factor FlgM